MCYIIKMKTSVQYIVLSEFYPLLTFLTLKNKSQCMNSTLSSRVKLHWSHDLNLDSKPWEKNRIHHSFLGHNSSPCYNLHIYVFWPLRLIFEKKKNIDHSHFPRAAFPTETFFLCITCFLWCTIWEKQMHDWLNRESVMQKYMPLQNQPSFSCVLLIFGVSWFLDWHTSYLWSSESNSSGVHRLKTIIFLH